ncbi:MAG: hypothetical protein BWY74_01427 [Firmicutes bacterium ADurb.Bin419]|nr:MAG: hypothetical protein BWY74_01427 [Firmicutes bacterium ADurb.Bin419]
MGLNVCCEIIAYISYANVNFFKLVKHISDYIYSIDEYKSMPKAKRKNPHFFK